MTFKFDIEYKIGNRKVSKREWLDHLAKSANETAIADARKRLTSVRCPVHRQAPEVTYSGGKLLIRGCCDRVVEAAKRALSSAGS